jgi:hypothetical protein
MSSQAKLAPLKRLRCVQFSVDGLYDRPVSSMKEV